MLVRGTMLTGGVVELTFPIPATVDDRSMDGYLDSVAAGESRADVASLRHLLSGIVTIFSEEGFHLVGPHEVAPEILLAEGAQNLGCDIVVARSVFAQNLPAMLERAISAPVREAE